MIILDANILLYAYSSSSPYHPQAKSWIEENLCGKEVIGIPWVTTLAFLRIGTNPRALENPFSIIEASNIISSWFDETSAVSVEATDRHWSIFSELITNFQVSGNLTTDAHLAALCLEHNASICTNDLDFTRFKGLKIINPIS